MQRHSNLQSFLDSVTPSVKTVALPQHSQYLQNSWTGTSRKNLVELFTFSDLWSFYEQWSACGVGTPILYNGQKILSYYSPSLSAIQIYRAKAPTFYHGPWVAKDPFRGNLSFEFFEEELPHNRKPLVEKVKELSVTFPVLPFYRSSDLSPASWMSIAWYPIYPIPSVKAKELKASFLTYHYLSSFQGTVPAGMENDVGYGAYAAAVRNGRRPRRRRHRISLAPFALMAYHPNVAFLTLGDKMQGNMWINQEAGDEEKFMSLHNAAGSWLNQLGVHHPDYYFFRSRLQ